MLGIAGAHNAGWLAGLGVPAVAYGDGLGERLRAAAPDGIDALLDCYGGDYVQLATELGVAPERIVTIIDFQAAEEHAAKIVFGHAVAPPRCSPS